MDPSLTGAAGPRSAAGTATILERLRAGTRAAHTSIESVPALNRLLAPNLTVAEYVETLRRLHAFHAGLEPDLARALCGRSRAAALVDGVRVAAIAADIAWFGAAPLAASLPPSLPAGTAAALGALYVVEGSNLGGRIIGRHVAKSLGVGPGTGGSYHCGLAAEEARRRWQLLLLALCEFDAAGVPSEPLLATALATFAALELWMREDSPDADPPRARSP
jgi:heme oxygenase